MRRILDSLTWLLLVGAVSAAFYLFTDGSDLSAGVPAHKHASDAARAACYWCRSDEDVEEFSVILPGGQSGATAE